jgi:hypothetical protein
VVLVLVVDADAGDVAWNEQEGAGEAEGEEDGENVGEEAYTAALDVPFVLSLFTSLLLVRLPVHSLLLIVSTSSHACVAVS